METLTFIDDPLVTFDALVEGGSPNKFPSAFDHVATLIPFEIRSFLVHYWRANPEAPSFALANRHFLEVQTHGLSHAALAVTDGTGRNFCFANLAVMAMPCLLYTSPSPRD